MKLTRVVFHHILVVSVGRGQVHAAAGPQAEKGRERRFTLALQLENSLHCGPKHSHTTPC